jgi:flavin reductase (DIM6/NTAB) family NADH-FMN oxidoreductase RutF
MQRKATIQNALKRKYPEPVALVTAVSKDGRANAMAVGWYSMVSDEPFMFAVCIDSVAYTYQLIKQTDRKSVV